MCTCVTTAPVKAPNHLSPQKGFRGQKVFGLPLAWRCSLCSGTPDGGPWPPAGTALAGSVGTGVCWDSAFPTSSSHFEALRLSFADEGSEPGPMGQVTGGCSQTPALSSWPNDS